MSLLRAPLVSVVEPSQALQESPSHELDILCLGLRDSDISDQEQGDGNDESGDKGSPAEHGSGDLCPEEIDSLGHSDHDSHNVMEEEASPPKKTSF